MVASCKLPFGIPSFNFVVISYPFCHSTPRAKSKGEESAFYSLSFRSEAEESASVFLLPYRNRLGEAAHRALVAHQAVAFHFHLEQQRVVVAVGRSADDPQPVAAGLALHPQRSEEHTSELQSPM